MNRKRVVGFIILLAVFALLATGCSRKTSSEKAPGQAGGVTAKTIRVATMAVPQYAPIFVAKQEGWLDKEMAGLGVTVKWTSFDSGPPMNEAFAAGQEDIGFMGDTPAIVARATGQDVRIVGMSASGPQALAVVVPKSSKIVSPKDLRGKKVAVVKGSYADQLLVLVLREGGLTTDNIQYINMTQADIGTALLSGDIDAGAIWEPLITTLQDEGAIRILADGTGIEKGALVILATNDFATKNPELIKAFLGIYQRGQEFIKDNPREAAELVSKDVNLSPEQLEKVMAKFDYHPGIHPDDIEELKKSEEFMENAGFIKTPVDIDTSIDTGYARSAGVA